jgi:hypothetical protein
VSSLKCIAALSERHVSAARAITPGFSVAWRATQVHLVSDRPKYANPPYGGPRSTFQLQSLICSTIASATISRSVSVSGRRLLPILNVSAIRTSRRNSSRRLVPIRPCAIRERNGNRSQLPSTTAINHNCPRWLWVHPFSFHELVPMDDGSYWCLLNSLWPLLNLAVTRFELKVEFLLNCSQRFSNYATPARRRIFLGGPDE